MSGDSLIMINLTISIWNLYHKKINKHFDISWDENLVKNFMMFHETIRGPWNKNQLFHIIEVYEINLIKNFISCLACFFVKNFFEIWGGGVH